MTFRGRPIDKCPTPLSGIKSNASLDWELAIQWWGYKREEFAALPVDDQARLIAVYSLNNKIEAVLAKSSSDEIRRG